MFKCFNCGATGDVIEFVKKIERTDFQGAIEILHLGRFSKINNHKKTNKKEKIKIMERNQEILKEAVIYWKACLKHSNIAQEYLAFRGITDKELIDRLNIGYAPKQGLYRYLLEKGFSKQETLRSGLTKEDESDNQYDFFRERIIFPVYDRTGQITTVTSRSLNSNHRVKHLHLRGAIESFYNEQDINSAYIIIVEGIFDCLSLIQSGFKAVAVFGTGGLKDSMAIKLRNTEDIYLCYDKETNQAGSQGIERAIDILTDYNIRNIYRIELPYLEGKKLDVNDLFARHEFTREDFSELMIQARESSRMIL
jgi:DNA primase